MKFQPDRSNAQTISGYGPGWIGIDADKITHSVIIGSGGLRQPWPCARFEDLTPEHFAQLAGLETELVIFGSGLRACSGRPGNLCTGMPKYPPPRAGHTVLHLAGNRFQGKITGCGRGHHQEQ